jgi:hypothetical protein
MPIAIVQAAGFVLMGIGGLFKSVSSSIDSAKLVEAQVANINMQTETLKASITGIYKNTLAGASTVLTENDNSMFRSTAIGAVIIITPLILVAALKK